MQHNRHRGCDVRGDGLGGRRRLDGPPPESSWRHGPPMTATPSWLRSRPPTGGPAAMICEDAVRRAKVRTGEDPVAERIRAALAEQLAAVIVVADRRAPVRAIAGIAARRCRTLMLRTVRRHRRICRMCGRWRGEVAGAASDPPPALRHRVPLRTPPTLRSAAALVGLLAWPACWRPGRRVRCRPSLAAWSACTRSRLPTWPLPPWRRPPRAAGAGVRCPFGGWPPGAWRARAPGAIVQLFARSWRWC